jgi:hypothetical protein
MLAMVYGIFTYGKKYGATLAIVLKAIPATLFSLPSESKKSILFNQESSLVTISPSFTISCPSASSRSPAN